MLTVEEVEVRNRELAERINQEALANPQSPYAGKVVGIANGEVVVVGDEFHEVSRRLREFDPDPARLRLVEASRDYTQVEYVLET